MAFDRDKWSLLATIEAHGGVDDVDAIEIYYSIGAEADVGLIFLKTNDVGEPYEAATAQISRDPASDFSRSVGAAAVLAITENVDAVRERREEMRSFLQRLEDAETADGGD